MQVAGQGVIDGISVTSLSASRRDRQAPYQHSGTRKTSPRSRLPPFAGTLNTLRSLIASPQTLLR